jgi:hypothetical protein
LSCIIACLFFVTHLLVLLECLARRMLIECSARRPRRVRPWHWRVLRTAGVPGGTFIECSARRPRHAAE